MFVWSKLSSEKWSDAWEERFAGEMRAVITRLGGRTATRVEVYCDTRKEAENIKKQFGGTIRTLKTVNWAALSSEPSPPVKVRDALLIVSERRKTALRELARQHGKRHIISIPAEMAFGTGHHATTSTVLRMLVDYARTKEEGTWVMADLGTGSGVLGIAAEKLGASEVWGCDYDATAVRVARENAQINGTANVTFDEADVLKWKPSRRWDCVAANLFSSILAQVFPKIVRSMKKDGVVLVSGILKTQAEECLKAGETAGIEFHQVVTRGKWVSAMGRLAS